MTYQDRYSILKKQLEGGLETYIKEVTVATLRIGKDPLPKGLRSRPGKPLIVGRLYYVIPKNPKERK
jgi:hypothetical protein